MRTTNRNWLPAYLDPYSFLPMVQQTSLVFSEPPYLFQDFVGKAISFLQSDDVKKMGFDFNKSASLPCKWKCSDESLFGVDLCLYAYTGHYPFDKGIIGGYFNEASVAAAVHHAYTNLDFGGSHVGYIPGPSGGRFGRIPRPLYKKENSAGCGHLNALLTPFQEIYLDACKHILINKPNDDFLISVPNEYLQPSWSRHPIKLLVDLESLVIDSIATDPEKIHTHKQAGRSLFKLDPKFISSLPSAAQASFCSEKQIPVGRHLKPVYFNVFDSTAELHPDGTPKKKLLPYMKHILAAKDAAPMLKAAVINTTIEHNSLTDCIRLSQYEPYAFACFTGVFIDIYDKQCQAYVNLFQPLGFCLKPAGRSREIEFHASELRAFIDPYKPAQQVHPLAGVLGYDYPQHILKQFTFHPGQA
jgi:hypothetical protein